MRAITKSLVEFLKKEDGPTAVEYAVMLALIIVVCVAAITTLGSNANNTFSYVGTKIAGSYPAARLLAVRGRVTFAPARPPRRPRRSCGRPRRRPVRSRRA